VKQEGSTIAETTEIETIEDARRVVDIRRNEMAMQRESHIIPLRREKERIQNLIKTLTTLDGTINAKTKVADLEIDASNPDAVDDLRSFLEGYRNRILEQLTAHEEQYHQNREKTFNLIRRIQQYETNQEAKA
jgi:hypothetical protein